MSEKAQTEGTMNPGTPSAAAPAAPTPPAAAAQPPPAPVAGELPPASPPAPPVVQSAARVPTQKIIGTEEELPTDADLVALPPKAFKARLERFSKVQLKEIFGTDDVDSIKAQQSELTTLRAEKEQQRLAQMTEIDRAKELVAAAERERDAWKAKAQSYNEQRIFEHTDRRIQGIVTPKFDPAYIDSELSVLSRHLEGCTREDLENLDDTIAKWADQRVADYPHLAIGYAEKFRAFQEAQAAASGQPPPPPAPPRVPLTSGPPGAKPPTVVGSGQTQQKTFAPNKPNSMSDDEARANARSQGYRW